MSEASDGGPIPKIETLNPVTTGELPEDVTTIEPKAQVDTGAAAEPENKTAPPVEQPPTTKVETAPKVEVTAEQRAREATMLEKAILNRIYEKHKKADKPEPAIGAINGYLALKNLKTSGDFNTSIAVAFEKAGDPLCIDFVDGKPVIAVGNNGTPITSIVKMEDGKFSCATNNASIGANTLTLEQLQEGVDMLLRRHVDQDGDKMLGEIKDAAQRKIIQAQMRHISHPDEDIQLDDVDLQEAAQATGLFTVDSAQSYIEAATAGDPDMKVKLMKILSGKNILTPEELTAIVAGEWNFPMALVKNENKIKGYRAEIIDLRARFEESNNVQERTMIQAQITEFEGSIKALEGQTEALKVLTENSDASQKLILQQFQEIYKGNADLVKAQRMAAAMEQGEMNALMREMIKGIQDPELKAKLEKMQHLALVGGGVALAVVLMIVMQAMSGQKG